MISSKASRRIGGLGIATAMVAALLLPVAGIGAARADTAPTGDNDPVTYSADALPTVQINGVVWSQVVVGSTVYATGQFTSARPAGAAAGTSETPRSNILAYNLDTGALITTWAPTLNAQGRAIAASADGTRIYVGGDFTDVSGVAKNRIVALDAVTGAVIASFGASANSTVNALAVSASTVYAGGLFTTATGVARSRLAAFDAVTGALGSWAPVANAQVLSLTTVPGTNKIVAGGRFNSLNGTSALGSGALDSATGATLSWPAQAIANGYGDNAAIWNVSSDGQGVYATGYNFGGSGNLESVYAADVNGNLTWVSGCKGDTYGTFARGGVVYSVSHAHDCSFIGGLPQTTPTWTYQRAYAWTAAASGTNNGGNFSGRPAPKVLQWLPNLAAGTYTGQTQAAWTVTGNDKYLVLGGEFPRVNGGAQQGLVRFPIRELSPNAQGPQDTTGLTPTLTSGSPGVVSASFTGAWDRDNARLDYELLRGDTVVARTSFTGATWYKLAGTLTMTDRTAPPGSTQSYRVRVKDFYGNAVTSSAVGVTVANGTPSTSNYAAAVASGGASNHWRLGESAGTTSVDELGGTPLTLSTTGLTRGVAGAVVNDGNTAMTFSGGATVPASTRTARTAPSTFSAETWFRTSSTRGGKLIGFGNSSTGNSGTSDRHIYMSNTGQLYFGVLSSGGAKLTINSPNAYNNNAWHHVVGTFSAAGGAKLYVDGALVASSAAMNTSQSYSGFWRVGGDSLSTGTIFNVSNWPARPSSTSIAATLDEPAAYPVELSAAAVSRTYGAGLGQAVNGAPTARFSYTASFRTGTFDARASTDPDGTVASYAWDFGDGTTGTGATPSHTFPGTGTYPVTLTVTDDGGATATTSLKVATTTPQNASPTARFTSTVDNLTAGFDGSGSTDPNGSIASYDWNFGDGTTGTGATASHTYAAAGTYAVTLTVTDDSGATAAQAGSVTVTAPGGDGTVVAADQFSRTVAAGLGNADTGGAWTASSTTFTSVSNNAAALTTSAGRTVTGRLSSVAAQDTDLAVTGWTDQMPAGGGVFVTAIGRATAAGDYRARVRIDPTGSLQLSVTRAAGTTETVIGGTANLTGVTYAVGSKLRIRVQTTGSAPTTVRAKAWLEGTTEPAAWTREVTDATAGFQVAGAVGVLGYNSAAATVTTVERFDDLVATAGTAAVNQAPTAGFSATPAELVVAFDGSASADADGSVAGYAWEFGDGSTGTGVSPSHTYAAAGTYPVTLTVTDDDGATATATRQVTVTSNTPVTTLAADDFNRAVTAGLGSAGTGGAWTATGTGVTYSVDGAAGVISAGAGRRGQAVLAGVSAPAVDLTHVEWLTAMPTGTGAFVGTNVRSTAAGDYRVRVRYQPTGAVAAGVYFASGGTETLIGTQTTVAGLTYTAGTKIRVRAQAVGSAPTTVRYRLWVDGTTEPTTWTEVTDNTAGMQVAGGVGFNVYNTTSATAAVEVRVDDLTVVAP